MTKQEGLVLFGVWTTRVWGPSSAAFVLPHVSLSLSEPEAGVLAALFYDPRGVWAVGDSLVRRASHYQLLLSERLMVQSRENIERVIIHEVVHLGYPRHDANFRSLVEQHGGALTESGVESPGVRVERKEGARYRTLATFPTEREARAWAREESQRTPGKYRLSM